MKQSKHRSLAFQFGVFIIAVATYSTLRGGNLTWSEATQLEIDTIEQQGRLRDARSVTSEFQKQLDAKINTLPGDLYSPTAGSLLRLKQDMSYVERVINDGIEAQNNPNPNARKQADEHQKTALQQPAFRVPFLRPAVITQVSCGGAWTFAEYSNWANDWSKIVVASPDLKAAVANVCRIDVILDPDLNFTQIVGTGFLVASNIVMTNNHVIIEARSELKAAGDGSADNDVVRRLTLNFSAEDCVPQSANRIVAVKRIRFSHPSLDLALLEIEQPTFPTTPLRLRPAALASANLSSVVVVGYPSAAEVTGRPDAETDECQDNAEAANILGSPWKVRRIAPGRIVGDLNQLDERSHTPTLRHDCTTILGNSGSPVIDLNTCQVVALHYREDPECDISKREGNYAIPLNVLVSDKALQALDIKLNWASP